MNKYRKNIDDFFRDKIGRPAETPPADVWANLEKRLDGLNHVPARPNRWLWHFAIVSLIVLLSIPFLRKMTGTTLPETTNKALAEQTTAHTELSRAKDLANQVANSGDHPTDATNDQSTAQNNISGKTKPTDNYTENQTATTPAKAKNSKQNSANNYQPVQHNALAGKRTANSQTANGHHSGQTVNASGVQESEYTANMYNSSTKRTPTTTATLNENGNTANKSINQPQGSNNEQIVNNNPVNTAGDNSNKTDSKDSTKKNKQLQDAKPVIASIPYQSRIEAGLKGGYEAGFNPNAATKYVISPYIQYSISEKFAVMAQPGIKYGTVKNRNAGTTQSYYKTNDDGTTTQVGNTVVTIVGEGSSAVPMYTATYNYSQSHDSIVKSYSTGSSYIECELPLMLKYYINKELSVYGGPNVVFAKAPGMTEHTTTKTIQRLVDITKTSSSVPAPLPLNEVFNNNEVPYTQYSPLTPSNGPQFRVGYMLGFSYEYSKKWLFDALLQQSNAQPELKAGYNINSPLSVPYFRLSVGYKLTNN